MDSNVELIILNEPPAPKLNYIYQEYVPTRVIELSDYKTKLDLRREFNIDHETSGTSSELSYKKCNYNSSRSLFNIENNVIVPKLPAGTIIVKKEDKKPKLQSRNASNIESIIGKIKSMKKMDKTKYNLLLLFLLLLLLKICLIYFLIQFKIFALKKSLNKYRKAALVSSSDG